MYPKTIKFPAIVTWYAERNPHKKTLRWQRMARAFCFSCGKPAVYTCTTWRGQMACAECGWGWNTEGTMVEKDMREWCLMPTIALALAWEVMAKGEAAPLVLIDWNDENGPHLASSGVPIRVPEDAGDPEGPDAP